MFSMYNPFDVADDIIVDIIRIGQEALQDISKETKEMKLKKEVLDFVKIWIIGFNILKCI